MVALIRPCWRLAAPFAALATTVLALSGCSTTVTGQAVSIYDNPFTVAGLPATSGPSGPRAAAAEARLVIENSDHGTVDVLTANAVSDIEAYWTVEYPKILKGQFVPVKTLQSWNPDDRTGPQFCGIPTSELINAAYCAEQDAIGWDRKYLLPELIDAFGPMSVVMVLAHEYGHAIQRKSGIVGDDAPGIVFEQQADCFAGAFIRHVAENKAPHFTLNTSDGLNSVLAAIVAVRDSDPNDPQSIHGSAFERVTAVQIGFTDGAAACAQIDAQEIESRRADLPQRFESDQDDGELAVTAASLQAFMNSFQQVFKLPTPPQLDLSGADLGCSDAAATRPVSYCPATNTIGVNVAELAERGAPRSSSRRDLVNLNVTGDYSAYVLLASRYTLAVQRYAGQSLTEPQTALRAACLSGVITAALSPEHRSTLDVGSVWLSPGDLDEAVSGLLSDGLAASDVNGRTVPSGFARVDAFRTGVLGGQAACAGHYR